MRTHAPLRCAPMQGKAAGGRIFEVMKRQPTIDLDAQGGYAAV